MAIIKKNKNLAAGKFQDIYDNHLYMPEFIGPSLENKSLISYMQKMVPQLQKKDRALEENLSSSTFSLKNLNSKVKNALEKELPNEFRGLNYKIDTGEKDLKEWKFKVDELFEKVDKDCKESQSKQKYALKQANDKIAENYLAIMENTSLSEEIKKTIETNENTHETTIKRITANIAENEGVLDSYVEKVDVYLLEKAKLIQEDLKNLQN